MVPERFFSKPGCGWANLMATFVGADDGHRRDFLRAALGDGGVGTERRVAAAVQVRLDQCRIQGGSVSEGHALLEGQRQDRVVCAVAERRGQARRNGTVRLQGHEVLVEAFEELALGVGNTQWIEAERGGVTVDGDGQGALVDGGCRLRPAATGGEGAHEERTGQDGRAPAGRGGKEFHVCAFAFSMTKGNQHLEAGTRRGLHRPHRGPFGRRPLVRWLPVTGSFKNPLEDHTGPTGISLVETILWCWSLDG
jgi:hypothetical protein